jgi:hypothetical protein
MAAAAAFSSTLCWFSVRQGNLSACCAVTVTASWYRGVCGGSMSACILGVMCDVDYGNAARSRARLERGCLQGTSRPANARALTLSVAQGGQGWRCCDFCTGAAVTLQASSAFAQGLATWSRAVLEHDYSRWTMNPSLCNSCSPAHRSANRACRRAASRESTRYLPDRP